MARKTKFEAQRTRQQIIEATRKVFFSHGIARTTLEAIASEAGVTRGAIYWHFKNKVALFFAMREQTMLPIVDKVDDALLAPHQEDPLQGIARAMQEVFRVIDNDAAVLEVFQIIDLRCEYVGEFAAVITEIEKSQNSLVARLTVAYRQAKAKGLLRPGLKPSDLALDSALFLFGLIRRRISTTGNNQEHKEVLRAIRAHVNLRRA